jgi:hypothetical protein
LLENDDFADAIPLTGLSGTTQGTNIGATAQPGEPVHAGVGGGTSVWWGWTAPFDGDVTVDTFGSSFDTVLAVYTGNSVDTLQEIASNDDADSLQSRIEFTSTAGTRYSIAVDGYAGATGGITLSWSGPEVQVVDIDIKPGNRRNVINPRKKGSIWVAILSDSESPFDPSSQVDTATVEFGPEGAKAARYKVKDVNSDGLDDLLLRFRIPDTGIVCGDTEASLSGTTFDGQPITGTDFSRTVGCKKK